MEISELQKLAKKYSHPTNALEQQALQEYLAQLGIDPSGYYQDLEMSSRYVNTHCDTSFSKAVVNLHSHTFYELLCCQECGNVEYLVGTERYRIQKGDILIIAPGVSHRPIFPADMEPYHRDVLWINAEFRNNLLALLSDDPQEVKHVQMLRTAGTPWEHLPDVFHRGVLESERKQFGWELAVIGNTITLFSLMNRAIRDGNAKPMHAEKRELLDQVMAYIEGHLEEKISLKDIARQFYVSESTVSHLFQEKMGVSFYRCVTQRRLTAAKARIWEGESLEAVSQAVGFSDYSSFYRAFKREYGVSPRQITQLKGKTE